MQFAVFQASLEANTTESYQPSLRSLLDTHKPSIPEPDLLAAALSGQLLVLTPELVLQCSNLPVGFGQIKPRKFVDEVPHFHGWECGMRRRRVNCGCELRKVRRLVEARLLDPETRRVRGEALRNFLVHGVPYAFTASPKEITRGMPTAWAAPAMSGKFSTSDQLPPVWPDPNGKVQGAAVQPLYPSVPGAAGRDPALYDLLALVDALRIGRARERGIAEKEITESLSTNVPA